MFSGEPHNFFISIQFDMYFIFSMICLSDVHTHMQYLCEKILFLPLQAFEFPNFKFDDNH